MREPARGATDLTRDPAAAHKAPFWGTLKMFCTRPVLKLASLGSGATQIVTIGLGNFAELFLMREKVMTLQDIALWYALVVAIWMSGGMVVSGKIIDRMTRTSRVPNAMAPAFSLVVLLPLYLAF